MTEILQSKDVGAYVCVGVEGGGRGECMYICMCECMLAHIIALEQDICSKRHGHAVSV